MEPFLKRRLKVRYEDKRVGSKTLFERAKRVIPGGVCHNLRFFPPYPFFVSRAEGAYLWDVDGNRYVDFWMGHYAHIFGHGFSDVAKAVSDFITNRGYHFGLVNPEEVELAELVVEVVPSAEAVKFCSSGTEAAMYAVRLARAYTGRDVVLKVRGGWHGASTDLSKGISCPFDVDESMGIPRSVQGTTDLIYFNDWEKTCEVIDRYGDSIACAIVEPVVGVGGFIPAEKEYLKKFKEKLHEVGALLIFDEVISGFRVSLGGYQEKVEVYPDLTVLGKVLGGGFPIGAVAGRKEILELSSYERSKPERVLMGGGTFSCNPISMLAGAVVLKRLSEDRELYHTLEVMTLRLREALEQAGEEMGVPVKTTGCGSLFMVHFMKKEGRINSPDDVCEKTYWQVRDTDFRRLMAERGVHMIHAGGALSTAHTEADLEFTVEAFKDCLRELRL